MAATPYASICTIGDEILIGQIVDTNSAVIARALGQAGVRVTETVSVGDSGKAIRNAIVDALKKNDIVIVTGGLGPTKDDVTKSVLYELSGSSGYVTDKRQLDIIHSILASRGLDVLGINRQQASVPDRCEVIPNRLGTAPVMVVRFPEAEYGHKAVLYSLPGVPHEASGAMEDVVADIRTSYSLDRIWHKTIMTYGIAESALSEKIGGWEEELPAYIHLAYLPDPLKGVALRMSIYGKPYDGTDPVRILGEQTSRLRGILGEAVYAEEEKTLQEVVGDLLRASGKTVSTAESCTGGMIASLLTSVPGASEYYPGSVVSYSNSVKENILGVPEEIIEKYGAVSPECVAAMAEGVRKLTGSDFSVATSGIAGPGGGSEGKPVGLVWVGISSDAGTRTVQFRFSNDRQRNVERFAASALNALRCVIAEEVSGHQQSFMEGKSA